MNLFEYVLLGLFVWWSVGFASIYVAVRFLEDGSPSRGEAVIFSLLGLIVAVIILISLIGKLGASSFFKKPLYERRRRYSDGD